MRFVFVGASEHSIEASRLLLERGHEIVLIEEDRGTIDRVSDEMDCGFLHGDGSKPALLREACPEETDVLFCLANDDKANILAALIGRSLGYRRVIPGIRDAELQGLCQELGLDHTIIPSQTIGRFLADMAVGVDILELSTILKGDARFFPFTISSEETGAVSDLDLPPDTRVIFFYRGTDFHLVDDDTRLRKDDEAIILTHSRSLPRLRERWRPNDLEKVEGEADSATPVDPHHPGSRSVPRG